MAIDMAESLIYSWLHHVKRCAVVQTNWKPSSNWVTPGEKQTQIYQLIDHAYHHFFQNHGGCNIFEKSTNSQIIGQTECDVVGILLQQKGYITCGVDIAYHSQQGVNYRFNGEKGSRPTALKITAKMLRIAMCLYTFMDSGATEVIFAAPKIGKSTMEYLLPCIDECNQMLADGGIRSFIRIIANQDFRECILDPVLSLSRIADAGSEPFLRSYQLIQEIT